MTSPIQYALAALAALSGLAGAYLQWAASDDIAAFALLAWIAMVLLGSAALATVRLRLGILAASLWCVFANAYLYFDWGSDICEIGALFSCGAVTESAYGTIANLPITLLGMGFFAGLAGASLLGPDRAPRFFQVSALFSLINLVFSLYLANGLLELGTICPFCVSIYAGNLIVLIASFSGLKRGGHTLTQEPLVLLSQPSFLTITGVFWLVVVAGLLQPPEAPATAEQVAEQLKQPKTADSFDLKALTALYVKPSGEMVLDGTEPHKGAKSPTYTVVEFADYGCPHCAEASHQLSTVLGDFPDVGVKFKAFPLSGECNPVLGPSGGIGRCKAAMAAECAHQQGAFWGYSEDMFNSQRDLAQSDWALDDLLFLARSQSMDVPAMRACMADSTIILGVVADAEAGGRMKIRGTPAFFIQGLLDSGEWVEVHGFVSEVFTLIQAHQAGVALPVPQ